MGRGSGGVNAGSGGEKNLGGYSRNGRNGRNGAYRVYDTYGVRELGEIVRSWGFGFSCSGGGGAGGGQFLGGIGPYLAERWMVVGDGQEIVCGGAEVHCGGEFVD